MARHHEWWYIRRLQKYYNEHYIQHDEDTEWFADPKPHVWRFRLPGLGYDIILTCDDNGKVTEERRPHDFRRGL